MANPPLRLTPRDLHRIAGEAGVSYPTVVRFVNGETVMRGNVLLIVAAIKSLNLAVPPEVSNRIQAI